MISDERLREAARKAEESFLASLPEPEDCEATFSPEFERKMKKLIRRTDHPIRHRLMKAVACFLLVVLVGGGSVLTFSVEARATFAGWVRDVYHSYETWFSYHYTGENNTISEDISYHPTWIPQDYAEVEVIDMVNQTIILYENTVGLSMVFGYSSNPESINVYVGKTNVQTERVLIGNIPADLYLDQSEDETNILTWVDSSTDTILWIVAQLDVDDLIKIAESVE